MIDTTVLLIDYPDFGVFEPEKFYPHAKSVLNLDRYYKVAKQFPSKRESQAGVYKPRLTLRKRPMYGAGVHIYLTIEFSIPKLMFGNNFDEVKESDFTKIIDTVQQKLLDMGVRISKKILTTARVVSIHYGKNYVLTDYTTPRSYMEEIKKANISKIYDVNQTDFRNEGHSWKFRTNAFEFTLYDKIKDLEKAKISLKRCVEHAPSKQNELLTMIREKRLKKPFEVLRLEIRLNGTRKIKRELQSLELPTNQAFIDMFSKEIAQKVCLSHLKKLRDNLLLTIGRNEMTFSEYISELITLNPNKKPKTLLAYAAFKEVTGESGMRVARLYIDPQNKGSWYRTKKQFEDIIQPTSSELKIDKLISKTKDFKTERLADYSQFM